MAHWGTIITEGSKKQPGKSVGSFIDVELPETRIFIEKLLRRYRIIKSRKPEDKAQDLNSQFEDFRFTPTD